MNRRGGTSQQEWNRSAIATQAATVLLIAGLSAGLVIAWYAVTDDMSSTLRTIGLGVIVVAIAIVILLMARSARLQHRNYRGPR